MIHTRVLELLKNPKNIQSEDLHLLKKEINSFPYIQNIRALHLYGVHLYDKENYQKALSATAAYTTDKKILYQLINGKIQQPVKPEFIQEKAEPIPEEKIETPVVENEKSEEQTSVVKTTKSFSDHDYEATEGLIPDKPDIKHLVVKGERNRILFDGEENFLDEDNNETIDLESTLESGVIVTQKSVAKINSLSETEKEEAIVNEELAGTSSEKSIDENLNIPETQVEEITDNAELNLEETVAEAEINKTEETQEATKSEIIINQEKIESEKVVEKINEESEISFQKIESFSAETESPIKEDTQSDLNKIEETQEAPKSEIIINEDKIDSEKVADKVNDESEISFQKIESFSAEPEKEVEETAQSTSDKTEEIKEVLNPELIIDEEKIESQQVAEKINDDAELSFHGTDSFLPEVKIESKKTDEAAQSETPKSNITKHEDEMRRLIEEVEKRMKAKKESGPAKKDVAEEEINTDISFAETQAFHVGEEQKVAEEVVVKTAESIVEDTLEEKKSEENIESQDNETPTAEPETEVVSTWKPMSFETSRPDSLLNKSIEIPQQKEESKKVEETPKSEPIVVETPKEIPAIQSEITVSAEDSNDSEKNKKTETPEKQNGEAPVMNVSFFGSDIASLGLSYKSDQKEKADAKVEEAKIAQQKIDESNVPGFINTWQSWLKIGRAEETPVDKTEIKNKVIESFIENNPKISQLKDEVNFVVKEKTDDISHLMTETLANLYIEQKLYSKAVNAFLVLSNKFPDRKEYFEAKIQEIKDSRNKS